MLSSEIALDIYKDKKYNSYCKGLAKKPRLAEELHSEFILSLYEITDNRLVEAKEGGYLDVFCVGVIHNIWGKRGRVKKYIIGSTSPLFETDSTLDISEAEEWFSQPDEPYDVEYDLKREKAINDVVDQVSTEMESKDETKMYKAKVFYYSYFLCKNPRQYSELSGTPYSAVIKTCKTKKEDLSKYKPKHD